MSKWPSNFIYYLKLMFFDWCKVRTIYPICRVGRGTNLSYSSGTADINVIQKDFLSDRGLIKWDGILLPDILNRENIGDRSFD